MNRLKINRSTSAENNPLLVKIAEQQEEIELYKRNLIKLDDKGKVEGVYISNDPVLNKNRWRVSVTTQVDTTLYLEGGVDEKGVMVEEPIGPDTEVWLDVHNCKEDRYRQKINNISNEAFHSNLSKVSHYEDMYSESNNADWILSINLLVYIGLLVAQIIIDPMTEQMGLFPLLAFSIIYLMRTIYIRKQKKIIDVTVTSYVIEMTGTSDKLDAFVSALAEDTIVEVVRSGPMGMSRGEKGLHL